MFKRRQGMGRPREMSVLISRRICHSLLRGQKWLSAPVYDGFLTLTLRDVGIANQVRSHRDRLQRV